MAVRITAYLVGCALALVARGEDARLIGTRGEGSVFVTAPGGARTEAKGISRTTPVAVPEHAIIETGDGIAVMVEAVPGAVAVLSPGGVLALDQIKGGETRTVRLNLTQGRLSSVLDPTRRATTDYEVHAPFGTVVAHGTVFAVQVNPAGVVTLSGVVTLDRGPGVAPIEIPFGRGVSAAATAQSISKMIAADPSVVADVLAGMQAVAANFAGSTSAEPVGPAAVAELAAVASAAESAAPSQSTVIAGMAISAILAPSSMVASSQPATLAAISAVTTALVRPLAGDTAGITAVTQAEAQAAAESSSSALGGDAGLNSAMIAITVGAMRAVPSAALAETQGIAQGLVDGRVARAVNEAEQSNPTMTGQDLARVQAQAVNSEGTLAALTAIASSAIQGQANSSAGGGSGGVESQATQIVNAVNSGASGGAAAAGGGAGAPQVDLSFSNNTLVVTTTASGGGSSPGSTSPTTTQSITLPSSAFASGSTQQNPLGNGQGQNGNGQGQNSNGNGILSALNQTQPVVSPSTP
jgi:hypothetical protein